MCVMQEKRNCSMHIAEVNYGAYGGGEDRWQDN